MMPACKVTKEVAQSNRSSPKSGFRLESRETVSRPLHQPLSATSTYVPSSHTEMEGSWEMRFPSRNHW